MECRPIFLSFVHWHRLFPVLLTHSIWLVNARWIVAWRPSLFFYHMQQLYVFLSRSTHRWAQLIELLRPLQLSVVKRLSDTRWSAHADATRAFVKGYTKIKQLLDNLSNDVNQPQDARLQADSLSKTMSYLETGIMAEFWYVFLDRINATSCTLQDSKMDLNTVVQLYKSLIEFIDQQRNDFGTYELRGKLHSDNSSYREDSVRKRKRMKQFDEGDADETEFNPSDRFKTQVFLLTLDKLRSALVHRLAAYKELNQTFGFLRNLEHASTDMIRSASSRLQQKYPDDFEDSLAEELLHFATFLRVESSQQSPKGVSSSNRQPELQLFLTIVENGLQSTFPNVETVLKLFLCMMTTNCTGERSFSTLKRVKNSLRSTMGDVRLNMLCLMSIEFDILRDIDFHDIVIDFARRKARKVNVV